jgi:hypothetical protein
MDSTEQQKHSVSLIRSNKRQVNGQSLSNSMAKQPAEQFGNSLPNALSEALLGGKVQGCPPPRASDNRSKKALAKLSHLTSCRSWLHMVLPPA